MGNRVDHGSAGPVTANCCPNCHTPMPPPQRRSRGELLHSLFYWALIVVNVVVLSWGAMTGNVPAPTLEEDLDCWSEHRMPRIEFITLETPESPREVLERDFPDLATLPVRGGWGYNLEAACIIEPPDDPDIPFDGVDVAYAFAAHRIYEELMFMRPDDDDGYRLKEIGGYRRDQAPPDVAAEVEAALAEHGVYRRETVYDMFWKWGVPTYPVGPIEELGF